MKEIQKLIDGWEAALKAARLMGDKPNIKYSKGILFGIKAASAIYEAPSNKVVEHKQTKPCKFKWPDCRSGSGVCGQSCVLYTPEG